MTSLCTPGTRLPYHVHFIEIDEHKLGLVMENDKFAVYADKLIILFLCWLPCGSKDLEGTLDAEAQRSRSHLDHSLVKSRMLKMWFLKMVQKIIAKDYISAPKKGKVITILVIHRKTNA